VVVEMSNRIGFFIRQRKLRKQELHRMIQLNPDLTLTRIKGLFSQRTGLTYKKIDQYILELTDANLVEINPEDPEDIKAVQHVPEEPEKPL